MEYTHLPTTITTVLPSALHISTWQADKHGYLSVLIQCCSKLFIILQDYYLTVLKVRLQYCFVCSDIHVSILSLSTHLRGLKVVPAICILNSFFLLFNYAILEEMKKL